MTPATESNTFNQTDQFHIADVNPLDCCFQNFLFFILIFVVQVKFPNVLMRLHWHRSKKKSTKIIIQFIVLK
jgi:hypothetical protein